MPGGGILGVNLFHRRIRDVLRTLTTLETVPWASTQRWVARPGNVGRAKTTGLELEAKGRLDDIWPDAPRVGLQANAAYFKSQSGRRSRARTIASTNNLNPPSTSASTTAFAACHSASARTGTACRPTSTRLSTEQSSFNGRKSVVDAYAVWTLNDKTRLRLSFSNITPVNTETGSSIDFDRRTRNLAHGHRHRAQRGSCGLR